MSISPISSWVIFRRFGGTTKPGSINENRAKTINITASIETSKSTLLIKKIATPKDNRHIKQTIELGDITSLSVTKRFKHNKKITMNVNKNNDNEVKD